MNSDPSETHGSKFSGYSRGNSLFSNTPMGENGKTSFYLKKKHMARVKKPDYRGQLGDSGGSKDIEDRICPSVYRNLELGIDPFKGHNQSVEH